MPIKTQNINNIYDLIDAIRSRPVMYIGSNKISNMRTFLDGYEFSILVHNVEGKDVFPPFWYFHEWAMHKYKWRESTAGWNNIILKENGNDEEQALKVFFEMIDEFKKLRPISIQKTLITKQGMAFHHSDKCQIKIIGQDLSDLKPVYESVDEVLLVEFSLAFGYSFFVVSRGKLTGLDWRHRFKDQKSAKKHVELLFGPQNNWEILEGDLLQAIKQIF